MQTGPLKSKSALPSLGMIQFKKKYPLIVSALARDWQ